REAERHFAELRIGVQSMTQPVEDLSGGQRQGVAVARAATWARRLVIMDEPTAALGVKETGQVIDLIRRVRERGLPVILISHDMPLEGSRAIVRLSFDLGITHFDLANNYGPPYGSAETTFSELLRSDLRPYRDELVISTKAGYDMWPGPYGEWGSRKYLLSSL